MKIKFNRNLIIFICLLLLNLVGIVYAQEAQTTPPPEPTISDLVKKIETVQKNANFVWTLVAAFFVFFMQAGFAMVETGLTRAKNAVNIMMKNLMDYVLGSVAFFFIGFGLMFGTNPTGFIGTDGFMLSDYAKDKDLWLFAFWMFQVVFAATSATIVSGAMAERTKFIAYLIYSFVISAVIYPIFGSWCWGGLYHGKGWLEKMGFIDFAGSTVVHSIGGWAALAGAIVLGPRIGKFDASGKPKAIPGHSITLATLGVFILWFGWFGFNPGSTTVAGGDAAKIAVNTNLAAATGGLGALITAWILFKKPEATMSLNGVLAGLVAITAPCNNVSALSSLIIGFLAGIIVVISVLFIEKVLKVDDPVGAVSVHGVCGAFGTLCAAIFNEAGFSMQLLYVQALGVICAFLWSFILCFILFKIIALTVGLRVSKEEEMEGLDITEHGNIAYPDFVHTEK
ncbi:MAG: ammonium transporter [Proteobacteria bacterium]|nr:ammonium transporter [Pseudomonadota bacterium]